MNGRASSRARSRSDVAYGQRPGGRRIGRPRATTPEDDHRIAELIIVGTDLASAARHVGATRAVALRVREELRELEDVGVSAGPVTVAPLAVKRGAGRKGRGKFGIRPGPPPGEGGAPHGVRADREKVHKAALLLIEGRSMRVAAELTGLTHNQARTVKSNLRVLQAAELGIVLGSRRW
jgi:hypothetical protein